METIDITNSDITSNLCNEIQLSNDTICELTNTTDLITDNSSYYIKYDYAYSTYFSSIKIIEPIHKFTRKLPKDIVGYRKLTYLVFDVEPQGSWVDGRFLQRGDKFKYKQLKAKFRNDKHWVLGISLLGDEYSDISDVRYKAIIDSNIFFKEKE